MVYTTITMTENVTILSDHEIEKDFKIKTGRQCGYRNLKNKVTIVPTQGMIICKSNIHYPDQLAVTQLNNFHIFRRPLKQVPVIEKTGRVCVLNGFFLRTVCHLQFDIIPWLLDLDDSGEYDLILCPETNPLLELVKLYKIKFKNLKFVDNQGVVINSCDNITMLCYDRQFVTIDSISKLKRRIDHSFWNTTMGDEWRGTANNVIYCTRNSGNRIHTARALTESNHQDIKKLAKQYCKNNNLNYIEFNACHPDGTHMSQFEQAAIFRSAKMVFGVHGGALSNIIHIPPRNGCKVCEFTVGARPLKIKSPNGLTPGYAKNYNSLYHYFPEKYLDYYYIPFCDVNDNGTVFTISIDDFKRFLN